MDDFFIFFHWTGTSFAVEALVGFVLRLVSANANYVKHELTWTSVREKLNEKRYGDVRMKPWNNKKPHTFKYTSQIKQLRLFPSPNERTNEQQRKIAGMLYHPKKSLVFPPTVPPSI